MKRAQATLQRAALTALESGRADEVLEVAPDCRWFRFRGQAVDLSNRKVLARVLSTLVKARIEHAGRHVDFDEVVAAGWPDERMQRGSAENRMRVALSTLRSLGLRGALSSRSGGVRLDPSVQLALRPSGP